MRSPHTIPYQGSKRNLAHYILRFFPAHFNRLIEPFAGSAAISIAAAHYTRANQFILNDINKPLVHLLEMIISNPESIVQAYSDTWYRQTDNPEKYYYWIRKRFNAVQLPDDLLFLLAKCIKSAVRYNVQGHFNQSVDKRFPGRNPQLMQQDVRHISRLLKGKTRCYAYDYQQILPLATADDLIYLDPPYQGTGITGGFNYAGKVDYPEFVCALTSLNDRSVPFILSYDGRTCHKTFGQPLPPQLNLTHIEMNAGRSSQATLLRRTAITYESLYLSPALMTKIDLNDILANQTHNPGLYAGRKRKGSYRPMVVLPTNPTNIVLQDSFAG